MAHKTSRETVNIKRRQTDRQTNAIYAFGVQLYILTDRVYPHSGENSLFLSVTSSCFDNDVIMALIDRCCMTLFSLLGARNVVSTVYRIVLLFGAPYRMHAAY